MNKSYLNWAGSKQKALRHLLPIIEEFEFNTFVEPFVGAGNVSLNVDANQYIWGDANEDLKRSHSAVVWSNDVDHERYLHYCSVMFKCGFDHYNEFRKRFNEHQGDSVYRAALFQYLNKHGFNGLCRYNKYGGFNVPRGTVTKKPKEVPVDKIKFFRERFKGSTVFINSNFQDTFRYTEESQETCLIYCDPPYVPAGTSDFNYTAEGFGIKDQIDLVKCARSSPHPVLISNHWNEVTKELYKDADKIWTFPVQRTISCDGGNRKQVEEVVALYR